MISAKKIKLIECPRDAMQGWPGLIATGQKIRYINSLLDVGFDTIDFGSFVSPKAIPQMADTVEVLKGLDLSRTKSKLLAIVANVRGASTASDYEQIHYLGFPFSISETFQLRNTNSSIEDSFITVQQIQDICIRSDKKLVVYVSMGFGNPYGDPYDEEVIEYWTSKFSALGIDIISLADTVGLAEAAQIKKMTSHLINAFPDIEIGVHLHSTSKNRKEKLDAAIQAGCKRFDGALKGIGGCPMAGNELVGNMDTEFMISYFSEQNLMTPLNEAALMESMAIASELFL